MKKKFVHSEPDLGGRPSIARPLALAMAAWVALTPEWSGAATTRTFSNARPIVINDTCVNPDDPACAGLVDYYGADGAPAVPVVPAGRYPSSIVVPASAFPQGSTITDVNVTISGLYHDYLDDVDILLVGPNGQYVMLASNVSAAGATPEGGVLGTKAENLNWIFDDSATLPLPNSNRDDGRLSGRTTNPLYNVIYDEWVGVWTDPTPRRFKPSDYDNAPDSDVFPAPAPQDLVTPATTLLTPTAGNPSTYKVVTSGPQLSTFNGSDPKGSWKLYVVDDFYWFAGEIKGGWSLEITVGDTATCTP
jgi:subtilisin-like proprotein convertase family protein